MSETLHLQAHVVYADDVRDPELAHARPLLRVEPTRKGNVSVFTKTQARKYAGIYQTTYIFAQYLDAKGHYHLKLTHECTSKSCKEAK